MNNIGFDDLYKYKDCLKSLAFDPKNTRGRRYVEELELPCTDPFIIDLNRCKNSKAKRRLGHKTQVFPNRTRNPYTRTRLSHSDEAIANGIMLASFLGLNTTLVEVQLEAHDFGHVVFGHPGENFVSLQIGREFKHYENSSYVVEYIERYSTQNKRNNGLNLSYETHEGILNHSRGNSNFIGREKTTQETTLSMFNDKTHYIPADFQDCVNGGYITSVPRCFSILGNTQRERMRTCNIALIKESAEHGFVSFNDSEVAHIFMECKDFMYGVYQRMNEREMEYWTSILKKVYEALVESVESTRVNSIDSKYDPILLLIMMVEEDLFYLVDKSFISQEDIENTSLKYILRNIEVVDKSIEIGTFDISLCCHK